jgi:chitosanase
VSRRSWAVIPFLLVAALLAPAPPAVAADGDLASPPSKEIAMQLVSSAENSSLDWRRQYRYIEDIGDGRGYTAGIIGFCSGTGDMLQVVKAYTRKAPDNPLARFLPALRKVNGTDSHQGLGRPFVKAWRKAAKDPVFQAMQDRERDRTYFNPAVALAKKDGLGALGQFAYYDAAVVHGFRGLRGLRKRTLQRADPPSQGESEEFWLKEFLTERLREMKKEPAHAEQLDRITKTQRRFLREGNLALEPPLRWTVNQTKFSIDESPERALAH